MKDFILIRTFFDAKLISAKILVFVSLKDTFHSFFDCLFKYLAKLYNDMVFNFFFYQLNIAFKYCCLYSNFLAVIVMHTLNNFHDCSQIPCNRSK